MWGFLCIFVKTNNPPRLWWVIAENFFSDIFNIFLKVTVYIYWKKIDSQVRCLDKAFEKTSMDWEIKWKKSEVAIVLPKFKGPERQHLQGQLFSSNS